MPGEYLRDELYHRLSFGPKTFDLIHLDLLDGLWYRDLIEPENQWISPGFWRTLGFDPDSRSHKVSEWQAVLLEEDGRSFDATLKAHPGKPGKPLVHELRFKNAAGNIIWMRCCATVVLNPESKPVRMLAVLTDITALKQEERRHAEMSQESEALRDINKRLRREVKHRKVAEKRFHHVFNASPNGLLLVDANGKLLFANRRLGDIFGYEADKMVGMQVEDLMASEHRGIHHEHRKSYNAAPAVRPMKASGELLGLRADGTSVPLEIGLSPADDLGEEGYPGDTIASVMDISERRRTARALAQYTLDLERSNADLDDFAYAASHDLKAPLRGIQQLSAWIADDLEDVLTPQTAEYITLLKNRVARLEKLLDDLLDYSRVGRRHGEFRRIDPAVLICEQFELIEAPEGFSLDVASSVAEIATLPVPLALVLRNLLSNAIKHHDCNGGCITVTVDETGDGYRFSVFDDGPGVPVDQRERIFQMFRTLKPRDEVEGSGMGLALVKKTLETYRQTIEVEENNPRGSVFHFTWPAADSLKAMINVEKSASRDGYGTPGGGRRS